MLEEEPETEADCVSAAVTVVVAVLLAVDDDVPVGARV